MTNRPDTIHGDRRLDRRYDLALDLRFSYDDHSDSGKGSGTTLDLSRGGVRLHTSCPIPAGAEVELRIAWPYLLQNVCPLELVVNGVALSSGADWAVVRTRRYEFRTKGARSFAQFGEEVESCSMIV